MRIFWGTVDSNGQRVSDGGGSTVTHINPGEYTISLGYKVTTIPAIVGSQTRSGNVSEANTDGIVFPLLAPQSATAITGDNTGAQQDRSFSFIAAGETGMAEEPVTPQLVLWGTINADGESVNNSGGFSVAKKGTGEDDEGQYEITFTVEFNSMPAIVATQTNSGNLSEANTDGIVVPILTSGSATLITGNNKSTPENRSFSFIAIGEGGSGSAQIRKVEGPDRILWGSINADGTIAGGSGGFSVGHQAPGMYVITFAAFANPPAIVGSQTRSNDLSEDNTEGMVFPWVNVSYAVAITGDATGNQQDQSFSFIVLGQPVTANPE
jgi:hypothetical protein